jgi:integrase
MVRRRRYQRALGPYRHGSGWRVYEVAADGSRTSVPFETEQAAREYVDAFNEASAGACLTVADALDRYERHYLTAKGNKAGSWTESKRRILRLVDPALELEEISQQRAKLLYQRLVDEGLAADSHRGYLTHTRTFFTWCVRQGWIQANPFDAVEPQGRKRKGREQLRNDEARAWMRTAYQMAAGGEWRALMAMLTLMLGMRGGEILRRRVRDVDDDCAVLWTESKTRAGTRRLRIPVELRPLLRAHIAGRGGDEPLFGPGHRVAYVNEWVTKICAAAGVRRVVAHAMRGQHSSVALEEGVTGEAIARAMGHETFAVTSAHYVSEDAKVEAGQRRVEETLLSGIVSKAPRRCGNDVN